MKFTTVASALLASQLVSAFPHQKRQDDADLNEAGALVASLPNGAQLLRNLIKDLNAGYGNVSDVAGAAPRVQTFETRNPHIANSKTVKIRYGPFKVPNSSVVNQLNKETGALFNFPFPNQQKPCTGECLLLGVDADLEYADGSNANIGNGMWLHHMVLFTTGPGRFDPTCAGKDVFSLPHILIGSSGSQSERLMASGNERTKTRFNSPYNPEEKLGYPLHPTDQFDFIVDFMNESKQDKIVYLTMTYDFVEGKPAGFSNFRSIWLDIVKCGTSDESPKSQTEPFTISQSWTANLDADIVGTGGHLHDGGTHLTLTVDDKVICDSVATYGVTPATGGGGHAHGGAPGGGAMGAMSRVISDMSSVANYTGSETTFLDKRDGPEVMNMPHITNMSLCFGQALGVSKVVKGQNWGIHAYYDYTKHEGMKTTTGKQSKVMGIAVMMVKNWSA